MLPRGRPSRRRPDRFRFGVALRSRQDDLQPAVAKALAEEVGKVQQVFDESRRTLRTVPGPDGERGLRPRGRGRPDRPDRQGPRPGHRAGREAGAGRPARLVGQGAPAPPGELARPGPTAASPRPLHPGASLVAASAGSSRSRAPRRRRRFPPRTADGLLDQVGAGGRPDLHPRRPATISGRTLGGQQPAKNTRFSFWSQGKIKGAAPATHHRQDQRQAEARPARSLFLPRQPDKAERSPNGRVPNPAGAPRRSPSERLDLVNGNRLLLLPFDEKSCHHVDDEQECRP